MVFSLQDALKKYGVRATFFINSNRLEPDPKKPGQERSNAAALIRTVRDGHVLADHSYDHMFHNSQGPQDAYRDVENDLAYFGRYNSDPVERLIRETAAEGDQFADYEVKLFPAPFIITIVENSNPFFKKRLPTPAGPCLAWFACPTPTTGGSSWREGAAATGAGGGRPG